MIKFVQSYEKSRYFDLSERPIFDLIRELSQPELKGLDRLCSDRIDKVSSMFKTNETQFYTPTDLLWPSGLIHLERGLLKVRV